MKEDEFMKRVLSTDEEAGHKLQHIMEKARQSPKYKERIYFKELIPHFDKAFAILIRLFVWRDTPEGVWYWDDLYTKLMKKNL